MSLLTAGARTVPNRVVKAPLTRSRSQGAVPGAVAVEYHPGAIAAPGNVVTPNGQQANPTPRAIETDEIYLR
ncbi:hypothetical protein GCM10023350_10360 [Nocardioides endophyticus]|uniref:Uncharacterized protein n=1 Tax=Nocardioides endophyticus TaxID=1353775 RepID=A0ABP8YG14_9ACTN